MIDRVHRPDSWVHRGIVLERGAPGSYDDHVTGDPCIVWDNDADSYRMFYFGQHRDTGGCELNSNCHALCMTPEAPGPGSWEKQGPVEYTNPEIVGSNTHKPWILMDPFRPGTAAQVDGRYMLFTVTYVGTRKVIHVASAERLAGPWTIQPDPIIEPGDRYGPRGYQVDTITAYWFANRGEILLFCKEYPYEPQSQWPGSPYGSSTAALVYSPGSARASRIGTMLAPGMAPWIAGWTSGVQLLPARNGGWWGLTTGSPTAPASPVEEPRMREPAPSLGGWVYTDEDWPVTGWVACQEPIVSLDAIPEERRLAGEQVNLWRHHLLALSDSTCWLYYNAGSYGNERMFCRTGVWRDNELE